MTTATRECSVERSGVLTKFNGQTSTVAVPCKYRLADIQCGDYQLVVTPGSKLDSDNTFSPVTLSVKILKSGPEEKLTVLTSSFRLKKVNHRDFLLCDGTILPIVSYPHRTAMTVSVCTVLVVIICSQSSLNSHSNTMPVLLIKGL